MQITCPNCTTSYEVEPSSLGRTGRSVRCVRCRQVWFAINPEVLSAVADTFQKDLGTSSPASPSAPAPVPDQAATPPAAAAAAPPPPAAIAPDAAAPELPPAESDETAAQFPAPPPATEPPPSVAPSPDPPIVADAPAIVPTHPGERLPPATPTVATAEDVESVAARRLRRRPVRRRWRGPYPGWSTLILALLALDTGLIAWRADVVRWLPQTAALYAAIGLPVNLRGLAFLDVATEVETQDGVTVLVVEGTIQSQVARPVEVPRLRFAVHNERSQEIYSWTAPPPEARELLVRFFNRRDLAAASP